MKKYLIILSFVIMIFCINGCGKAGVKVRLHQI